MADAAVAAREGKRTIERPASPPGAALDALNRIEELTRARVDAYDQLLAEAVMRNEGPAQS